jgi:hypothetical protein
MLARTMLAAQLIPKRDPAAMAPAGVASRATEFTVGDTIAGMGSMDAFDRDHQRRPRKVSMAERITHGLPTKPNPFKSPIAGPGKYAHLGMSDEDFVRLRDRGHIVSVMVRVLAIGEEEAESVFDRVAERVGRDTISAAEFYDEFRGTSE